MLAYYYFVAVVDGRLLVHPEDSIAVIGSNVVLACQTNNIQHVIMEWRQLPVGKQRSTVVSNQGHVIERYTHKFFVNDTHDGVANLMIINVSFEDSGQYFCKEIASESARHPGEIKSAYLVVIGSIVYKIWFP